MQYVFWGVIGFCILVQLLAYIVWFIALRSPNRTQNNDHAIADDDQTRPIASKLHQMIDALNAIPYETVSVRSRDGKRLFGRLYVQDENAPVILCFHGYRGTPSRDFSGGMRMYREAGYSILMVEERAHLRSEGRSICMGVMERYDALEWIRFVQERFGENVKIVLGGISMGAATVLMTSCMKLPNSVRGIIADAPFSSPKEALQKVMRDMHLPVFVVYPLLVYGAWLFGGFNLNDPGANVTEAVKRASVPILLIHGEDDRFVPCEMGKAIAAANPDRVELQLFPNAGHGLSFMVDEPRYRAVFAAFLNRVLSGEREASVPFRRSEKHA